MFKRKGGGSKAFWTMLKKTALFSHDGFPYCVHRKFVTMYNFERVLTQGQGIDMITTWMWKGLKREGLEKKWRSHLFLVITSSSVCSSLATWSRTPLEEELKYKSKKVRHLLRARFRFPAQLNRLLSLFYYWQASWLEYNRIYMKFSTWLDISVVHKSELIKSHDQFLPALV